MFSFSHAPVASMPLPVILSTLPPPLLATLNAQPRPIEAPTPLALWRLSSCLPIIHRLVVVSHDVTCLRLASPFVVQLPHVSILNPPSLFTQAGCCVAPLRTASASQHASTSQLTVSLASPMHRHHCRWCAGVFAVIAIAIVALDICCQAGIVGCCPCRCQCLLPLSSSYSLATLPLSSLFVVVAVAHCAIAIIIGFVACRAVAIARGCTGDFSKKKIFSNNFFLIANL